MNNAILNNPAQKANKKPPFLDVGEAKEEQSKVDLFPIKKALPIKVFELGEMDNKLRLYMKGADGELFKFYVGALRSINEIIRVEIEKAQKESKKCK